MRVIVLSDTHSPRHWKALPGGLLAPLRGADLVLHAGDVCTPDVLDALVPRLTAHAVVIVERSKRSPEPTWPAGLEPFSKRSYGETIAWEAVVAGQPAEPSQSA